MRNIPPEISSVAGAGSSPNWCQPAQPAPAVRQVHGPYGLSPPDLSSHQLHHRKSGPGAAATPQARSFCAARCAAPCIAGIGICIVNLPAGAAPKRRAQRQQHQPAPCVPTSPKVESRHRHRASFQGRNPSCPTTVVLRIFQGPAGACRRR